MPHLQRSLPQTLLPTHTDVAVFHAWVRKSPAQSPLTPCSTRTRIFLERLRPAIYCIPTLFSICTPDRSWPQLNPFYSSQFAPHCKIYQHYHYLSALPFSSAVVNLQLFRSLHSRVCSRLVPGEYPHSRPDLGPRQHPAKSRPGTPPPATHYLADRFFLPHCTHAALHELSAIPPCILHLTSHAAGGASIDRLQSSAALGAAPRCWSYLQDPSQILKEVERQKWILLSTLLYALSHRVAIAESISLLIPLTIGYRLQE